MKNLYFIGGPMGVGKTEVSQKLKKLLAACVMLDGDRCWDADPFIVTDETKAMVTDNICHVLNNFLRCSAYQNVVFCWVMHEQSIIDGLLSRLDLRNVRVISLSLTATPYTLKSRLRLDVDRGIRDEDVIPRSLARLPLYAALNTVKLDTTDKTPDDIAKEIARL